jgi:gluconate 5-dehydrogenase
MNLFNIKGKRVLITGSTGGIGYVLAEGLAKAGAELILNGRTREKTDEAVASFSNQGLNVSGYTFDITDSAEVERQIANIENDLGGIDVLVNNAGIQHRAPLEDFSLEDWNRIMNTNLTGAFLVSKAVVKSMIKRQSGKIINICSLQSELGRATITPYASAKGGLKMLTKGMAAEWAKHNIQVNGIGPGYFKTKLTKALWENPEFDTWLCNRTPAHRWGNPEELVGTLIYLASDASSFLNGQIIYVDGGITACI